MKTEAQIRDKWSDLVKVFDKSLDEGNGVGANYCEAQGDLIKWILAGDEGKIVWLGQGGQDD